MGASSKTDAFFLRNDGVMVKPAVGDLSDDDQHDPRPAPAKPSHDQPAPGKTSYVRPPSELRGHLGRLCRMLCLCARQSKSTSKHSCFRQFHGGGLEALFQLHVSLNKLSKQDKDAKALSKRPTNSDHQSHFSVYVWLVVFTVYK